MAIFNWAKNPYFTPTCYISVFGVDSNDGSVNAPYRTLQKAKDAVKRSIHIGPGCWREAPLMVLDWIFAEGTVIDGTSFLTHLFLGNPGLINIRIINTTGGYWSRLTNCFYKNISSPALLFASFKSVLKNVGYLSSITLMAAALVKNTTFDNCWITLTNASDLYSGVNYSIFYNCRITVAAAFANNAANDYNILYGCSFKFGSDTTFKTQSDLESLYGVTGIDAVRAYHNAKFGTYNVFPNCKVIDPMFNNVLLEDYTLNPFSLARNMAYDGTFIGAKDIGYPTYAYASDLDHPNAFYNASKSANILIANNSITLVRNADGSAAGGGNITEKSKDLSKVQELKTNQLSFVSADRNREMPNASPVIDYAAPMAAGMALISGNIYINEVDAVTYNTVLYPVGSRIYAIDNNTFTGFGLLYLVKNNLQPNINLLRFKQSISGTKISSGTNLTANSWYRVYDNQITWNSLNIMIGDVFQAIIGKLSFAGLGKCVEEFNDSDVWGEFIINAPITVKRVGNIASAVIDVGTNGKMLSCGHPEYSNITNKVRPDFTVFARYIQTKHFFSVLEVK